MGTDYETFTHSANNTQLSYFKVIDVLPNLGESVKIFDPVIIYMQVALLAYKL